MIFWFHPCPRYLRLVCLQTRPTSQHLWHRRRHREHGHLRFQWSGSQCKKRIRTMLCSALSPHSTLASRAACIAHPYLIIPRLLNISVCINISACFFGFPNLSFWFIHPCSFSSAALALQALLGFLVYTWLTPPQKTILPKLSIFCMLSPLFVVSLPLDVSLQ
jgi:hypothetical protein